MAIKMSSGLRAAIVGEYGLERMMRRGHIRVYTGHQPASADAPVMGDLVALVTTAGLTPVPGEIEPGLMMAPGQIAGSLERSGDWVLRGVGTGVAGWWRFVWNANDDGQYSEYYPRIDGSVGESLILPDNEMTPQILQAVGDFFLYLPSN